jgi:hypothetical protein
MKVLKPAEYTQKINYTHRVLFQLICVVVIEKMEL